MPETDLAQNLQATALAAMLEQAHTPHELAVYRGALTPRGLDAPEMETAALASGAAIHDLGWMRRVAVRGADRFRWLSGMVTNTVNDLFPNTGAWNLVLNAQGHIQGDLTVWRGGEEQSPQRRSPSGAGSQKRRPLAGNAVSPANRSWSWRLRPIRLKSCWHTSTSSSSWTMWNWFALGEEQVGETGSETAIGLSGPLAGEVLERVGLPVMGSAMAGTSVEWNGLEPEDSARLRRARAALRVLAAVGGAGEAVVVPAHRRSNAGGLRVARGLSHCRRDSGVRHRHGGARPAAGDRADAGAAL